MKSKWILLAAFAVFTGYGHLNAGIIYFGPSVTFTAQQPVRAVIVDADGNAIEKTYTYDPSVGGVDLGIPGGPATSIYFPDTNVRYLWSNGCWVGEDGYYWNHGNRVYIQNPEWRTHWNGYWTTHSHWHDEIHNHGGHQDVSWRYRENNHFNNHVSEHVNVNVHVNDHHRHR